MERSNYEQMDEQQNLTWFTPLLLASQVLGIIAIILVAVWTGHYMGGFAWSDNASLQFNYHPLFMVIGLIVVYGNAILVYRVFRRESKMAIKVLHAFLQLCAFVLTVVALVAVFDLHNALNMSNMYSLHSWVGMGAIVLFACQFLLGFVSFLFPKLHATFRKSYLPVHQFFGVAIFVTAIVAAVSGITEKALFRLHKDDGHSEPSYHDFPPEGVLLNALGCVLVLLGGVVVFLVVNPNYRRLSEEERYAPLGHHD